MSQQDKEKEHFDKGKKAFSEKNYTVTINEFTKAIEIDSTHADTFYNRGVAYEMIGEFNKAINDFTSAIEFSSEDNDRVFLATIYNKRGSIYSKKRNLDIAIENFTKAIELNPDFTDAYFNRGNTYLNIKDNTKAIEDYNKAIEIDPYYKIKILPNLTEAHKIQGLSSLENKNYDDAIKDFTKAIELQPNDSEAYSKRGLTYAYKTDYPKAINNFDEAIKLNSNNSEAYYHIGRIYDIFEDFDKAIDYYSKTIELAPYFVSAYSNRGLLYSEIDEYDKAIEDYNTVIEFNKENSHAYNNRGHIYRLKEKFDEAIDDFNEAIKLDQYYDYAYNNLGSVYNDQGNTNDNEEDFNKAIINFTKAIELKSDYAVAFHNLGVAYASKCVIYVKKIIQYRNNNTSYSEYENTANKYYYEAITNFTEAIKLKPDYVNAYNNRGKIYEIKGEHKKAQKDFIKARGLPQNRVDDSSFTKDEYIALKDFNSTIKGLKDAPEINTQLLYKFKAVNKNTLSALIKESIWVANPKTFNDPLDGSYLYDKINDPRFNKDLEGIGIISFEGNEAEKGGVNTLMWSHYADSHKGICLIYKRVICEDDEQLSCNNKVLKVKYEEDISLRLDTTEKMIETGFQTKHSSWKYEEEFRLILHQAKLNNGSLFTTKELGLELTGVILGLKCNEEDIIKKILNGQNIEYYKIEQEVKHRVPKHLQLVKKRIEI